MIDKTYYNHRFFCDAHVVGFATALHLYTDVHNYDEVEALTHQVKHQLMDQ